MEENNKKRTLKSEHPDIAELWHPTFNEELTPADVSPRSNKKVWWICSVGHAYQRTVDKQVTRTNSSCPVCNGKLYVAGVNDVKSKYPEIADEWNYEINRDKRPEQFSFISSEKVGWKCKECGTEWETRIKNRCIEGHGCPQCASRKRWEKRYSNMTLGITDPSLLEEWDYELNEKGPECYTPQSGKTVHWHCKKCGYRYTAKINNKANGRKCACCQRKVVVPGINDLATTHKELANEWDYEKNGDLRPENVLYGTRRAVYWKCPRGHSYKASINHRSSSGRETNCPICNSGRQTSFAEQAFFYYIRKVFPTAVNSYKDIFDNAMELDIYIPDIKIAIEYDGVYWHQKKSVIPEREQRKYEICKEHSIKLLRVRENSTKEDDVSPADYKVYIESDGTDMQALSKAIIETIKYLIDNTSDESNNIEDTIPVIDIAKDRFRIMSYLQGPVKNSVQEVAPELVKDWDYEKNGDLKPDMISAGSSQSVNWICHTCGYEWEAPIYHRAKSHTGCPKCLGLVFEKGINDLKTKNPELLIDWDYEANSANNIFSDEIMFNSGKTVNWICHTCGYKWSIPLRNRSVQGSGCIQCGYEAGQKTKQKKLLEEQGCITDPLLLSEWDFEKNAEIGLSPYEVTPGSNKYAFWTCSKCGYKWKAPIARRSNGVGCRKCADKANPDLKRKRLIEQGQALTNQLLLEEWDYEANAKSPQEYTMGSNFKAHWICSKCGYKWAAAIHARNKGAGCPACAGNILVTGRNDLATVKPELAKEWDYEKNVDINPNQVSYSSGKKYWWKCTKGHASYLADPAHRSNGTGCPLCAKEIMSEKASKPIDQLTLNGEFIRTFKSAKSAEAELGINSSGIGNAIRKGTTSGGYRWRHHIEE